MRWLRWGTTTSLYVFKKKWNFPVIKSASSLWVATDRLYLRCLSTPSFFCTIFEKRGIPFLKRGGQLLSLPVYLCGGQCLSSRKSTLKRKIFLNSFALWMAKTLWSFGHSEHKRVKLANTYLVWNREAKMKIAESLPLQVYLLTRNYYSNQDKRLYMLRNVWKVLIHGIGW